MKENKLAVDVDILFFPRIGRVIKLAQSVREMLSSFCPLQHARTTLVVQRINACLITARLSMG